MCDTCGCNDHDQFTMHRPSASGDHSKEHSHPDSEEDHSHATTLNLGVDILSRNNLIAERNRGFFEARKIKVFNLVSSPGSGKTTLLERMINALKKTRKIYVIEGDQQTTRDAERIQIAGAEAIQINTGNGCHLDAHMINHAVIELNPKNNSVLFIENVGNLVCPALFDLGEQMRIVVASTTEGEDKPLKYAQMFQSSHLCLLNKIDLLPYLDFSVEQFRMNLDMVKPEMPLMMLSAKTGEGFDELISFI